MNRILSPLRQDCILQNGNHDQSWIGTIAMVPLLAYGSAPAERQERIRSLEKAVLAPCCYTETVAQRQREVAVKMRIEIATWVEQGRTDERILDTYARRYGARECTSLPPHRIDPCS